MKLSAPDTDQYYNPSIGKTSYTAIDNEFRPKIRNYLKRLVGDFEAEDLTQIVFCKIHKNLYNFKGKAKLSTWIFKIATNTALDQIKSRSFKYSSQGPNAPISIDQIVDVHANELSCKQDSMPEQKMIRKEMHECIREYVNHLPVNYRTIIILNELKGLSMAELAEILSISTQNTKIRLHRARAALRKSLENGCDFYTDDKDVFSCNRKQ